MASFRAHKSGRADVVEGRLGGAGRGGPRVVLARPRCYMNESGGPVAALAVVLQGARRSGSSRSTTSSTSPFDTLRVKLGGGDNGHNGLRSMRAVAGHRRLLPGPGRHRPARRAARTPADFVLSDYSAAERKVLPFQVDRAADAVESLLTEGLERTQSVFNS